MDYVKFNGVLEEIKERYPNIDIKQFLQQKLGLLDYRAEELATRIEKQYFQKSMNKTLETSAKTILEKNGKPDCQKKTSAYSVDCLSEREFKFFIKWLFEELGYEIQPEKNLARLWVDFVATHDGKTIAIQALKYPKTCKISDSIFLISQEAKRIQEYQKTIVLTTAYFTQKAMAEAQRLNVELWDKDTLGSKIEETRKKASLKLQAHFPQYTGSLLQSLLKFEETGDFFIEPRAGGKYDLHLSGIKFPLLTFQAQADVVIRCVYRIKNNKPVGEHESVTLIGSDCDNKRVGPDEIRAYTLIIQYLEKFLR